MKLPAKFDARKLMEQTINIMRHSVDEPRSDGKTSPRVGALIFKPDGSIETAYRGELRDGDHAEFTLLERKNRNCKLDCSILFATLEPCAPDARKYPKLGCAERIVLARIKEVWVGIEDPDPTVDRKGIKYLQDNGINVHMFDSDLQEVIQNENKAFLAQAHDRAAEIEKSVHDVKLSILEDAVTDFHMDEIDSESLELYRTRTGTQDTVGSLSFNRRLARLGLLTQNQNEFIPTGFGLVLFGKEPRVRMPQACLLATIHYKDGTEEVMDFSGPQVQVPDQAITWLRTKIPNPIERSEAQRQESNKIFYQLAREAIVNALVHRDYSIAGAKCQLIITPDTIVVMSPGSPIPPITVVQLKSFEAPMLSRNPVLHFVFAQMQLAEERGIGLKSMKNSAQQAGLPLPQYSWADPYLVLTLFRNSEAAVSTLPADIQKMLTESELAGWRWLTTQIVSTSSAYSKAMKVEGRTARRHLNHFVELGLVQKSGSGPSIAYTIV